MSNATKNWLILLVGVLAVAMVFKTFLDGTGFSSPIQSASSTTKAGDRTPSPQVRAGRRSFHLRRQARFDEAGGTPPLDHGRRIDHRSDGSIAHR